MPIRHERPVRFADVDAARIVYFARYLDYCHDAIEALFGGLPGGYAHLTMARDVGVPSVRVEWGRCGWLTTSHSIPRWS